MKRILLAAFAAALSLVGATAPTLAQEFPLTVEHKFGTSVIEAAPERVASVDYAGADDLLALGVQPVVIRHWYGDYPRSVWPWADTLLEGTPVILKGDLDYEAIAAADPDIIIALWSGITTEDYEKLSLIAPVVPVAEGMGDYAMPWHARAIMTGRVLGLEAEATALVNAIQDKLADAAAAHPAWSGQTTVIAAAWGELPSAYTSADIRAQLMAKLGFHTPAAVDALMDDESDFVVKTSLEDFSPFESDLLIWLTSSDDFDKILAFDARPFLEVTKQGREVFAGKLLSSAFSHASLLSLPYAIDRLVPMIEVALDGDPSTNADDR